MPLFDVEWVLKGNYGLYSTVYFEWSWTNLSDNKIFSDTDMGIVYHRLAQRSPGGSEMFGLVKSKRMMQNLNNRFIFLLLICDAVHNAMTSQQCNADAYCMVVLHACIHEPLVRSQRKPKIVCSATGSMEYGKPTLDLQVALSASSKNTRCATSAL